MYQFDSNDLADVKRCSRFMDRWFWNVAGPVLIFLALAILYGICLKLTNWLAKAYLIWKGVI